MDLLEEQEKIYNHNEGDLIVSASAGSGKTFIMIERLVRLLSEEHENKNREKVKPKISEILALTYTEAAANEMKNKLNKRLKEKYAETQDQTIMDAITDLPIADIGTVHSFCAKLIRRYFSLTDVSAGFGIIDDDKKLQLQKIAWEQTLSYFYQLKESQDEKEKKIFNSFIMSSLRYNNNSNDNVSVKHSKNFKEIIIELYDYFTSKLNPEEIIQKSLICYDDIEKIIEQMWEEISSTAKKNYDKALKMQAKIDSLSYTSEKITNIKNALKIMESFSNAKDIYEYSVIGKDSGKVSLGGNYKDQEMNEVLKTFVGYYKEVTNNRDKIKSLSKFDKQGTIDFYAKVKEQLNDLIVVLNKFTEIYGNLKHDENVLDFNDLERYALKILSDEKISKEIKSKYKFIVIDEYQDINDVQNAIFDKIDDDNMFMVGDLKQSIYGFRGSNPELFIQKEEALKKEGKAYGLNCNFRSSKKIIDAVNEVFLYCMNKDSFNIDYDKCKLNLQGKYIKAGDKALGRAQFHILKKSEKKKKEDKEIESPKVYDIIEASKVESEADISLTGKRVAQIIFKEIKEKYFDIDDDAENVDDKFKKIGFKDIAILVESNPDAQKIANALKKYNIPVITNSKVDITNFKEVAILICILKLIICFENPIPLATVMKSPIGGFSNLDLYKLANEYKDHINAIKEKGNKTKNQFLCSFKYALENETSDLHKKVISFKKYIDDLRDFADYNSAKEVLKKIIREKDYLSYVISKSNGEEKEKRVNRFVLSSGENGEKTVSEFISSIAINPVTMSSQTIKDAVLITTIHKSKGLQYPVVIVPFAEKSFNSKDDKNKIMKSSTFGIVPQYYDDNKMMIKETLLRDLIREQNEIERARERMRLYYVALTRAKYSLHVIFEASKTNGDERKDKYETATKYIHFIPSTLSEFDYANDEDFEKEDKETGEKGTNKIKFELKNEELVRKMKQKFNFNYDKLVETTLPLKSSVTSALKFVETEYDKKEEKIVNLFDDEKENPKLGTTAHKILELYDFNGEDFNLQLEKMKNENKILSEDLIGLDLDKIKGLVSGEFKNLVNGKKLYREKSFIVNLSAKEVLGYDTDSDILVQGIIDLLVVDGEKAIIVDYKYSKKNKESLLDTYKKQLKLYESAVKKALGFEQVETYIVSIIRGEYYKV